MLAGDDGDRPVVAAEPRDLTTLSQRELEAHHRHGMGQDGERAEL